MNPTAALRNRATLIFTAALVVLIVLSAWWLVFFQRAISNEYMMMRRSLADAAHLHALRLRVARDLPPPGVFQADDRFEVVEVAKPTAADAMIRAPWALRPQVSTLKALDAHYTGRRRMLTGEGVLLTGLLGAVVAMLYRLVRAEHRFRDEMAQFLSRVTHEMKTPLAGIKAVLQVVESGRVPAEQVPVLASRALREVQREHHLIQNLLLAQRMRQPGATLAHEPVELVGLLSEILAHRRDLPGGVDVRFTLSAAGQRVALATPDREQTPLPSADSAAASGPEVRVTGDPAAIRSIVDNLLDNAVKYGGLRIQVELEQADTEGVLRVIDDGMGFDPAVADALFAPFHRTKAAAGGQQGTGLGLHISRTLAQRMGGDVSGASAGPGQGATFAVRLPLAESMTSV